MKSLVVAKGPFKFIIVSKQQTEGNNY